MTATPCPLCGADVTGALRHNRLTQGIADTPYDLLECDACGLIFLHPLVDTEVASEFYTEDYYGEENVRFWSPVEWISLLFRRQRSKIIDCFRAAGRALDVGCGRGEFLLTLRDRGWEVDGIEVNEVAARRAKGLLGDRIFVGDLTDAGYPDASFDLIGFYHVIEHVADPVAVMEEIYRVLKPGGMLLLATPNFGSWAVRLWREEAFGVGIMHNCYYLDPSHIERMTAGRYEVVDESHFSLEQDPFSYLQSLLNHFDRNDNFLYSCLHRRELARLDLLRIAKTFLLAAVFAAPALAMAVASARARCGYSMSYVLRKREA